MGFLFYFEFRYIVESKIGKSIPKIKRWLHLKLKHPLKAAAWTWQRCHHQAAAAAAVLIAIWSLPNASAADWLRNAPRLTSKGFVRGFRGAGFVGCVLRQSRTRWSDPRGELAMKKKPWIPTWVSARSSDLFGHLPIQLMINSSLLSSSFCWGAWILLPPRRKLWFDQEVVFRLWIVEKLQYYFIQVN